MDSTRRAIVVGFFEGAGRGAETRPCRAEIRPRAGQAGACARLKKKHEFHNMPDREHGRGTLGNGFTGTYGIGIGSLARLACAPRVRCPAAASVSLAGNVLLTRIPGILLQA